jgi:hypothetical protein
MSKLMDDLISDLYNVKGGQTEDIVICCDSKVYWDSR